MGASALDELRRLPNLRRVWEDILRRTRGRSAPGIDDVTPTHFRDQSEVRLRAIQDELGEGYRFSDLRGLAMPKKDASKLRLICVPTIADRIVQRALMEVIEGESVRLGILNKVSYGFVRVRDPRAAKRGVQGAHRLAVRLRHEAPWAFKADIQRFFDTIPRDRLAKEFCAAFGKRSLFPLVRGVIGCEVDSSDPRITAAIVQNKIERGVGLRQGMPLSPILSNFLLRDFDSAVAGRHAMVRYADDLIVFCRTEAECQEARRLVEEELGNLGLTLSPSKSGIVPPAESVEFLGMELREKENGKYELVVTDAQLQQIRSRFTDFHDFDFLQSQGIDAATLFRRLDQMRLGYLTAYGTADNFGDLEKRTSQWIQTCALKVYGAIFTPAAVSRLSAKHKRFLMLP